MKKNKIPSNYLPPSLGRMTKSAGSFLVFFLPSIAFLVNKCSLFLPKDIEQALYMGNGIPFIMVQAMLATMFGLHMHTLWRRY